LQVDSTIASAIGVDADELVQEGRDVVLHDRELLAELDARGPVRQPDVDDHALPAGRRT
jgi:hypothetical protein